MAKYKIVHYINQFFAGIGGEEKADYKPEVREEALGPGAALAQALGEDYEIVATVICGDNYFGENLDEATDTIIDMVKKYEPDVFFAGPAFNAGRYGVACGTICKAVEERLGIPVLTAAYEENPGVDMFRKGRDHSKDRKLRSYNEKSTSVHRKSDQEDGNRRRDSWTE